MPFTITRFDQVNAVCNTLHEHSYRHLHQAIKKNRCLGFVATLIVETTLAVAFAASLVGALVETIFKGMIHIVGSPCSKKCNFYRGFKALTFVVIYDTLQIPSKIFQLIYNIPKQTISFLFDSQNFAKNNYWNYRISNLKRALEIDSSNVKLLDELDEATKDKPQNEISHRFSLIEKTFQKDNMVETSFSFIAQIENLCRQLFELHQSKANLKDLKSKFFLAILYQKGIGTEANRQRSLELLKECAESDYLPSMYTYAEQLILTFEESNLPIALEYLKKDFLVYNRHEAAIAILAIITEKPSLNRFSQTELILINRLCENHTSKLNEMKEFIKLCIKPNVQNNLLQPPQSPLKLSLKQLSPRKPLK